MTSPRFSAGLGLVFAVTTLGATPVYRIPLYFEQTAPREFQGGGVRLTPGGFEVQGVRLGFKGSQAAAPTPGEAMGASITRIAGATRHSGTAWRTVRYESIYPGINAVFHDSGGQLEFDLELAPGADPSLIRLGCERAVAFRDGDLVIQTPVGEVKLHRPLLYQDGAQVDGEFRRVGNNEVGFRVGGYDRHRALLIDPTVSFSTYLGGTGNDWARGIATDSSGNVYIAGATTSTDLPVTASSPQSSYKGHTTSLASGDAFVAKFNGAGQLIYMTYLGGTGDDYALGIAVDSGGNAYVTGMTNSTDFPITSGAFQRTFGGAGGNSWSRQGDAFVAKLNPSGTALVYSTYIGGSQDETALAIAVDSTGAAVITGTTLSTNFPVTAGAYQTNNRGRGNQKVFPRFGTAMFYGGDVFVAKLNPAGSQLTYATLVGGGGDDVALSVALDSGGNAYVGGYTLSTNFPVTDSAFQKTYRGASDANEFLSFGDGFLFKLNASGTALVYSTLLGGNGDDVVDAVRVDTAGNLYACGTTASANFPVTASAFQRTYGGPLDIDGNTDQLFGDAFVARFDATGNPVFITFLGGENDDHCSGIALDGAGNILVAGNTVSNRFPVTADAAQKALSGFGGQAPYQNFGDLFFAQLSPDGRSLMYSTYHGGSQDEVAGGIAFDPSGNAFVTGNTVSRNFPVTTGAYRSTLIGYDLGRYMLGDAVLVKFSGLTAGGAAKPVVGALVNAASNIGGTVSPGMLFVAYTQGAGPGALAGGAYGSNGLLGGSQSGVRYLFDGVAAPLLYVSAGQSSGIVPYTVAAKGTVQLVVEYSGVQSDAMTLKVADAVPGLFSTNFSGSGQGAILNQDGSVNSAANPADRGSVVVLYGTGEGQTDPAGQEGRVNASVPYPKPKLPVSATVGGALAQVLYAGAAPGLVSGVLQVNVQLPASVGGGNVPIAVQVGSFASQGNLTVAVK